METKNLAVKVNMDLWRAITIVATNGNKTLGEVVVPVLEREFGTLTEVTARSVKQAVVKPEVVARDEARVDTKAHQQANCRHSYMPGVRTCMKCGWVPPIKD